MIYLQQQPTAMSHGGSSSSDQEFCSVTITANKHNQHFFGWWWALNHSCGWIMAIPSSMASDKPCATRSYHHISSIKSTSSPATTAFNAHFLTSAEQTHFPNSFRRPVLQAIRKRLKYGWETKSIWLSHQPEIVKIMVINLVAIPQKVLRPPTRPIQVSGNPYL